ncbi:MAG: type IV pilin N-terminal domain-containing protein [Methanolobus sp.]
MKKRILILCDSKRAVSPVIGVILMLFLTILLAGVTVSAVYSDDIGTSLSSAPMASVKATGSEGSVGYHVSFDKNFIYLEHTGGDPLQAESTNVVISGDGSSYIGVVGHGGSKRYGDVVISYDNLLFDGKEIDYASRNSVLSDGEWSAGEEIILNGQDAISSGSASSVITSIDGFTDTSNNYGLKKDSTIKIKIFDTSTQRLISECECKVTPAE